jgi:hypothetical protein
VEGAAVVAAQQAAVAVQQAAMVAAQQPFSSADNVRMSNVSMGQPDMVTSWNGWNQPGSIVVGTPPGQPAVALPTWTTPASSSPLPPIGPKPSGKRNGRTSRRGNQLVVAVLSTIVTKKVIGRTSVL